MQVITEIESLVITFVENKLGLAVDYSAYAYMAVALLIILLVSWVANFLVKKFLLGLLRSLASKTNTKLAKYLLEESFFLRLSHLAPAFVISSLSQLFFAGYPVLNGLIEVLVNLYLVGIALWVFDSLIDTFYKLYDESRFSSKLPLKGICQAIKILVNGTGIIFILSPAASRLPSSPPSWAFKEVLCEP